MTREQTPAVKPAPSPTEPGPLDELTLEREKIQIERERLALERERWTAERDKQKERRLLADRAAGRMTIGISTFSLALLCSLLIGGAIGAWMVAKHQTGGNEVAASLIQAFGSSTNSLDEADLSSPLIRSLGRPGRAGGYLLILN